MPYSLFNKTSVDHLHSSYILYALAISKSAITYVQVSSHDIRIELVLPFAPALMPAFPVCRLQYIGSLWQWIPVSSLLSLPPGKYCCPQIKRIHLSDCQSPRAGPNDPPRMTLITGSPSLCPRPPSQVLDHPRQPWHQNTQLIGHYVVGLLEAKIQKAKMWIYPDISNPEKNQWLKHGSG